MKDLDRRLAALGHTEIDRDLSGLERDVWAQLDARARLRPMPRRLAAALCCATAVLASAAGAGVAAAAASAPSSHVFGIDSPLAPSSLLND